MQTIQQAPLVLDVELDEHVAAEDDVEAAEMGEIRDRSALLEMHTRAQILGDLPALALLMEIAQKHRNRQTALHLDRL